MSWRRKAACLDADPAGFEPVDSWTPAVEARVNQAAARHCGRCPVVQACAEFADADRLLGTYGGAHRSRTGGKYRWRLLVADAPIPVITDRRTGARRGWAA